MTLTRNIAIERGTYVLLRASGSKEIIRSQPNIERISEQIGAACVDTVNLRFNSVIMLVDDDGQLAGKPVNSAATEFYRSVCKPGTTHQIVGDVALVNDEDFE